jgi:hypothetical protein
VGKASELDDWPDRQPPLTEAEIADRERRAPRLKLREGVLPIVGDDETVSEALKTLAARDHGAVELSSGEPDGQRAVLLTADRYAQLVGAELAGSSLMTFRPESGSFVPDGLASSDVQPVDPTEPWGQPTPGFGSSGQTSGQ